jgi:hypothetical protein
MIHHIDQPLILDPLAIVCSHRSISVPHDVIHSNLISGVAANGRERVPQAVKTSALAVQSERLHQLGEFFGQRIIASHSLVPCVTAPGYENQPAMS